MEFRAREIVSKKNNKIKVNVIPGHFATSHSHINYYLDMTKVKHQYKMAECAAEQLAQEYAVNTMVDTIVCVEGTEMIGALLAQQLSKPDSMYMNSGNDITVVTPEPNASNQMIFRENIQRSIWNKNVLLLFSSVTTGKTVNRISECINYYSGIIVGLACVFSALPEINGLPVRSIFSGNDLPGYETYSYADCPHCKQGQKLDAIVNSYGYSRLY